MIDADEKKNVESFSHEAPGKPGLEKLFSPRSVAIVGASANLKAIGGQPIRFLLDRGFKGNIYPINPKYEEIAGLPCLPDIGSLPEVPDLLLVALPARMVEDVIAEAGRKKIPFAIIFSSGFAEMGKVGQTAQERLCEIADSTGLKLIGPNCQGLMNIKDGIHIGFGAPYELEYRKGGVSITSQSGAFGNSLIMGLNAEGVGFHHYISTGNEASMTSLDFFEHFVEDSETKVVAGYIEGLRDAYRLRNIGKKALQRDKPLVIWKVGNTAVGARAAASHTANLAGNSTYYQTAFRQFGIIGVNDVGDMADCVRAFMTGRRPRGNGVAILTISGGAGISLADRSIELGLELTGFGGATLDRLRPLLPAFASLANPLDVTAGALNSPDSFAAALRVIVDAPDVDMIALALAALSGEAGLMVAREIAALAAECEIPILVTWNALPQTAREAYPILESAGVPVYSTPVRCARGLGALWEFSSAVRRFGQTKTEIPIGDGRREQPAQLVTGNVSLNELESKKLLAKYGITVTREDVANSANEAVDIAQRIGFPVVLKILSADIPHKSDMGGVRVGLENGEAVRTSYLELANLIEKKGLQAKFDGILVQEMVGAGTEVILGAVWDPCFGPLVMFGAGGIYAEVFKDVAFRLAPISRKDAEGLIADTKISHILAGVRGHLEGDREALINSILGLSQLITDQEGHVTEIDVNPLFVLPKGRGVMVADALVRVRSKTVKKL